MKILNFLCWLGFTVSPFWVYAQSNAVIEAKEREFGFFLKDSCVTSAGVYTNEGVLLRTLWSGKNFGPGKHTAFWDGTDDEGILAEDGNYVVKVLSNNVKYIWQGVIGNTSDSFTGSSVFRGYYPINGMAIAGSTAYYCKAFSEGSASYAKFSLSNPHAKQWLNNKWRIPSLITSAVACDGANVYWANIDPPDTARSFVFATKINVDSDFTFSRGQGFTTKFKVAFKSVIDLVNNKDGKPTGLSVQKIGRYLLIAHAGLNEIHVIDKLSGQLVQNISIASPFSMAMDATDNVWIIYLENNTRVVRKFEILANGTLSAPTLSLSNVSTALAVAVSPDNKFVVVADGAGSQQLKAYNNQTGNFEWVFGKQGGYVNDPTVNYDKFYFTDQRPIFWKTSQTFISFQPDGSFWVGDPGNARVLHFSAQRKYLDEIMYLPDSYSCVADPNNPSRVFSDYLEFKVDYNKPLAPNNGSWVLVKNWGATVPDSLDAHYNRFTGLTTLQNGKTYALFAQPKTKTWQIAELPAEGPLRFTGVIIPGFPTTCLYKDGSLRTTPRVIIGKPITWTTRSLAGFDSKNNPLWGVEKILVTSPPTTNEDPGYWGGGILHTGEITSSGVLISFDNSIPPHGGDGYHLGGIKLGDNKWLWKTAYVTNKKYSGQYPDDGAYDIGNGVAYAGSVHIATGRNIFWGYHGEFWKSSQVNKWNHVWDDGLFVGQFGATGIDDAGEAAAAMAGNSFSASLVQMNDSVAYLYHNDESYHSGIHRWKISGLNTIKEQIAPIVLVNTQMHGLLVKAYEDTMINNLNTSASAVLPLSDLRHELKAINNNIFDKKFSITLSGFIKPLSTETYSFYTGVNAGSRLWINGQLLVNNYRPGTRGADSGNIYLTGGKEYAILVESSLKDGNTLPTLLWSSKSIGKQPVPLSQLVPTLNKQNLGQLKGVDLMEGLPNNSVLENGLYGWTRDPAIDDSTNRHSKWLSVKTSIKKFDKHGSPDVYIFRTQGSGNATVSRNLGNITVPLKSWALSGNISFEKNFPNVGASPESAGSGGCYFELLDKNGKILFRVYPAVIHFWDDVRLYANDKVLLQANIDNFRKFADHPNKIVITYSFGKLNLQFAGLPPVSLNSFDGAGQLEYPQSMRVFFWGNGNAFDRIVDLEGFYFER